MSASFIIPAAEALRNRTANRLSYWHRGGSDERGSAPLASARVYTEYCPVHAAYNGPKLELSDPVFTMGSCFAREIEWALLVRGGNVVSTDFDVLDHEAFAVTGPRERRAGFFHRFTPRAIWQEFRAAFGRLPQWDEASSLLVPYSVAGEPRLEDLNYWYVDDSSFLPDHVMRRRAAALALVRRAAEAKVIILTLGLAESWRQKSTGLYLNRFTPRLAKACDDYEFEVLSYDDVLFCLEDTLSLLRDVHNTGDFTLVVTTSPVPLTATMTGDDIIVANMNSKATIRAAVAAFCRNHPEQARYFPSYEIALYSDPATSWRPDTVHVDKKLVGFIVETFMGAYYADYDSKAPRL